MVTEAPAKVDRMTQAQATVVAQKSTLEEVATETEAGAGCSQKDSKRTATAEAGEGVQADTIGSSSHDSSNESDDDADEESLLKRRR